MRTMKAFGIAVCAGLCLACSNRSKGKLMFSGTMEMTEHNVGAASSGKLIRLLVGESDRVSRGQMLGWLEHYDKAKRDYDRALELFRGGGATHQQVEDAELAMKDLRVVSPVDGFVLVKVHEEGEVVASGSPILDIGDSNDVFIRIYVPEGEINRVRVGQAAEIRLDGIKKVLNGRVSLIDRQAEFTPRNVQTQEERVLQSFGVKIAILEPPGSVLPGVDADVEIKE